MVAITRLLACALLVAHSGCSTCDAYGTPPVFHIKVSDAENHQTICDAVVKAGGKLAEVDSKCTYIVYPPPSAEKVLIEVGKDGYSPVSEYVAVNPERDECDHARPIYMSFELVTL